ncbi:MAG: ATP-binding cassette domain-containing protein [Breznakia sp.]
MVNKKNLDIAKKYAQRTYSEKNYIEILDLVGLKDLDLKKKIFKLSGGEQQRIAIARLLVKPCEIILVDEPTGSLDKDNGYIIFELLRKLQKARKTVIIVTHDIDFAN